MGKSYGLSRSYNISQNTKANHSAHTMWNTPSFLTGDSVADTSNIQSQSQSMVGREDSKFCLKHISFPNIGMYFPINMLSVAFQMHSLKNFSSL